MKVAALYARISGQDDPRTASIESQLESGRAKAISLGYAIGPTFIDRISGTELYETPPG